MHELIMKNDPYINKLIKCSYKLILNNNKEYKLIWIHKIYMLHN